MLSTRQKKRLQYIDVQTIVLEFIYPTLCRSNMFKKSSTVFIRCPVEGFVVLLSARSLYFSTGACTVFISCLIEGFVVLLSARSLSCLIEGFVVLLSARSLSCLIEGFVVLMSARSLSCLIEGFVVLMSARSLYFSTGACSCLCQFLCTAFCMSEMCS